MRLLKCLGLFFFTIMVLLFFLISCSGGNVNMNFSPSPSTKSVLELITQTYIRPQLEEIAQYSGNLNELNDSYPIECLRKKGDTYRVSFWGEDSLAILIFDSEGNKSFGKVYTQSPVAAEFNAVLPGKTVEDVKLIDPEGEYLFLYTGRNDYPYSTHYTRDGYFVIVEYDSTNTVIAITKELI